MSIQDEVVALLGKKVPQLQAVYLFGSAERGDARTDSDIDLAVLAAAALPAQRRFDIAQELAVAFSRDVDLVDLRAANTVMRATIVSAGRRIYCADPRACADFENIALSAYARLNEERRGILNDIRERGQVHG